MATTITIDVDPETAEAYANASEQERKKVRMLLRIGLGHRSDDSRTVSQVMSDIDTEANGLTEQGFDDWDKQIGADVVAGKFDRLIAEARADKAAGRFTDL